MPLDHMDTVVRLEACARRLREIEQRDQLVHCATCEDTGWVPVGLDSLVECPDCSRCEGNH